MSDPGFVNQKLNQFKQYIKNKNVAVIGIGVSNMPLIKYLSRLGVNVTAFDRKTSDQLGEIYEELKGLGVEFSLGADYLSRLTGYDVVFRTPGMRHDIPELVRAREEGARVTSEMEVFLDLCPAYTIGVTGSDGKTTTTTLIHEILSQEGYKSWLGGNIGTPLLDRIDEIIPDDKVVLELSSFQLQTISKSVNTAVVTNVTPNHLDIHKSMDEYVEAKKNIYRCQASDDILVLNYDNMITRGMEKESRGRCIFFSRRGDIEGVVVQGNRIVVNTEGQETDIIGTEEICIPGFHNVENYLAAIAAVYTLVKPDSIRHVARTFAGVEHRIELVRELNGVKFYNDSIASSPARTAAGLNSLPGKVILIAGGYDKKIPYEQMGEVILKKVKALILLGQTGPKIRDAYLEECRRQGVKPEIPVCEVKSLEEAVRISYNESRMGDVVILSPASASFDIFRNFEERGNTFKKIVNNLSDDYRR